MISHTFFLFLAIFASFVRVAPKLAAIRKSDLTKSWRSCIYLHHSHRAQTDPGNGSGVLANLVVDVFLFFLPSLRRRGDDYGRTYKEMSPLKVGVLHSSAHIKKSCMTDERLRNYGQFSASVFIFFH